MSAAETAFNKAEAAMLGWDVKGETVKDCMNQRSDFPLHNGEYRMVLTNT